MIERTFTLFNDRGLHMRPSQKLVDVAKHCDATVIIKAHGRDVSTRSLLHVMAAGIRSGDTITVVCEGPEESEAMAQIQALIENDFGLEDF